MAISKRLWTQRVTWYCGLSPKAKGGNHARAMTCGMLLMAACGQALTDTWRSPVERVLTGTIHLENHGSQAIEQQIIRLTIPSDIKGRQKVLAIQRPSQAQVEIHNHPNQVDRFLEIKTRLAPWSLGSLQTRITLRLSAFNYQRDQGEPVTLGNSNFLRATTYVESDADEFLTLAKRLKAQHVADQDRLLAAYHYSQQILQYRQIDNRGGLFALRNGFGDCTEYASVFAATARAMGYPARLTSEFNFAKDTHFEQPNHHAAEVFLNAQWIPVDPNLGTVAASGEGFGITGTHKIVLKRDGSWVWSATSVGVSKAYRDANLVIKISWDIS